MPPPVRSNGFILHGLATGKLRPTTTVISDSLTQPGLLLFRELIDAALARNENVCVVCCEIDSRRFAESLRYTGENDDTRAGRLQIQDCNLDNDTGIDQSQDSTISGFDIEDLTGLSHALSQFAGSNNAEHTTIYFDSLNALSTFNNAAAVLRILRKAPAPIVLLHHTDVPISPSLATTGSSSHALLPSLLNASGRNTSIHFTLHPPALLAHLHYVYSIEDVGQADQRVNDEEQDQQQQTVDPRVYQYLHTLHKRGWGSPLSRGETESERWNGYDETSEDTSGSTCIYDSPDASRITLDLLGKGTGSKSSNTGGTIGGSRLNSEAGRCVLEYALRGVNRSNKRSNASKVIRGLEGVLSTYDDGHRDGSRSARSRHISSVPVDQVLRIKQRSVKNSGPGRASQANPEDPTSYAIFNLSLTDRQREAREGVALPYTPKEGGEEASGAAHEGEERGGAIIYEPDSADDVDESDPDEDLDL